MQQSCRCTKSQSCPVEPKDAGESCSANSDCKAKSCKGNVCCNLADAACLKCFSPSGGKCAECDSNTHCLSAGKCYKKADEECQPKIEDCATNDGTKKLDLPAGKCRFSNFEEVNGEYKTVNGVCENGKYFYEDDSFKEVCSDMPKPVTCGSEQGDNKKAVTEACKCGRESDAPMCAKGDFCWHDEGTCEKKAFPCEGMMVSYCGPKSSDDQFNAQFKAGFEGACFDMATCDPEDIKKMMAMALSQAGSDSGSESGSAMPKGMCGLYVSMSSKPDKCQGPCMGGMSKQMLSMVETQLGCTEEETTALVENSNEAAAAQGLEPIASAGHGVSFAAAVSVVVAAATSLLM
jgi:hypothetical protein